MQVSARRLAIGAGVLAGVYLVAVFAVRGVPDWIVALFGGPNGGVARYGGLVLRYRPPPGADLTKFQRSIERRGAKVWREGPLLAVDVPGVSQPDADRMAAFLTHGGLEFREALEDQSLASVPQVRGSGEDRFESFVAPGVRLDIDLWRPEDGDQRHSVPYLRADRRDQLERAFEQLRADGWVQPPHSIIAFERFEQTSDDGRTQEHWRSYLLGDEVLLDGDAVANALRTVDPNTGRPIVLLDLTPAGTERFGKVTTRLVGHKLATVLGGLVQSAPIINGPILGGRASIWMGNGDVLQEERDADALVSALAVVALPSGGEIQEQRWVPPASITTLVQLAMLAIGIVGGGLLGLVTWLVVRSTRPVWQPGPRHRAGRFPVRRVLVTLLAPVALIVLDYVGIPGINEVELAHVVRHGGSLMSVTSLGVSPILAAFIVVELATLVTGRGRRARYQPAARIAIGRYVAILGAVFAIVQSYFVMRYLDSLSLGGAEILAPGGRLHLAVMASLTAGTMLLVIVAGMIREHGLGNGYGAVIISRWALTVVPQVVDGRSAGHALGVVTLAGIGVATVALLRMRVGDEGEAPLRVPASGSIPLATAGAVVLLLWWLVQIGWISLSSQFARWLESVQHQTWLVAVVIVVLVPLWSFAFSRPGSVAPLAAHTALASPSETTWRRATLLSLWFLLGIGVAALVSAETRADAGLLCEATTAMMLAALVLDLSDDLRARRAELVAVWPLQHAQHAELVRRVLRDAGIDCHLQASHLRTLLGFFGPYVPIDVLVPAASAVEARNKIGPLFGATPLNEVFS